MKYCISGRQALSVLKKADEIKMKYQDINKILDFITDIPDKTIILEVPREEMDLPWATLEMYSEKLDFVLCIQNLFLAEECKKHNIKFYWYYPITTYYELQGVLALGPSQVLLGAPLTFDLPTVKGITDLPLRMVVNQPYEPYMPREDGICGQWVRPEDTEIYAEYITSFEFAEADLQAERAYLHIYKDNKVWPGNLNLLFKNFGVNVDNRGLFDDIGVRRTYCRQRCMSGSGCRYCKTAIKFSEILRTNKDDLKQLLEEN